MIKKVWDIWEDLNRKRERPGGVGAEVDVRLQIAHRVSARREWGSKVWGQGFEFRGPGS